MEMPRPTPLILLAASLLVLALPEPASCAYPVLIPVAKDPATSLYTIPIRNGDNHVIDLAGPLLWSTCASDHLPAAFSCNATECRHANAYRAPSCRIAGQPCKKRCKVYPYNPITGQCAAANLVHTRFIASTTDGKNPLQQVSVRAVAACAPRNILASLPKDVTGVAGLSASGLALPAQVAASHRVARKFLLCLPRSGEGVAIFGGGPLFLLPETSTGDLTTTLAFTPLRSRKDNPLYYIPVQAIAVNEVQVPLPANALAAGGVVLCTRVTYTALRPDVYRPVVDAFDRALARNDAKVPAVAPFDLCYRSSMLWNTHVGYAVPDIALVLEGGKRWTFVGSNSMVDVNGQTACLAFVEMKGVKAGDPSAAAAVIGGFQMENHLLQFDLEKQQLGFANVPFFSACSNFNFTKTR
ncbi:basic 7S globulin-like [Panicum miliaceum]|uniref:Basic 7S globulin-like n=1 Tax=Panicum miliaceum TaxID=4540 RepID=A0A3L6SQL2_PANMI|nr:basic 7S globulin-like [Panicum miliaceum]